MVQKRGIDRFADGIVASKTKADIGHATGNFCSRANLFDLFGGFEKVDRVVVVFAHPRRDGQDVRIEDNVFGRETDFADQQIVSAFADSDFVIRFNGLSLFIKRHHHGGGSVTPDQTSFCEEVCFAFFQADRVHDRLALHISQSGFDYRPLTTVDHDRHAGDIRLARD